MEGPTDTEMNRVGTLCYVFPCVEFNVLDVCCKFLCCEDGV